MKTDLTMTCQCGAGPLIAETSFVLGISLERFMLPCQTKKFLGFDCPGCGFQRAVQFFVNGDFWAAFKMYPAIYPIVILVLFLISDSLLKFKFRHPIRLFLMLAAAGTIIVSYIIKMNHLFT